MVLFAYTIRQKTNKRKEVEGGKAKFFFVRCALNSSFTKKKGRPSMAKERRRMGTKGEGRGTKHRNRRKKEREEERRGKKEGGTRRTERKEKKKGKREGERDEGRKEGEEEREEGRKEGREKEKGVRTCKEKLEKIGDANILEMKAAGSLGMVSLGKWESW